MTLLTSGIFSRQDEAESSQMQRRTGQFYLLTWELQFRLRVEMKVIHDSLNNRSKNIKTKKILR